MPEEIAKNEIAIPIIQDFLGTPVRFFPTSFYIEMRYHNDTSSYPPYEMKTWAIPLPDFCRATRQHENHIGRMIRLSNEVFKPFYRRAPILDSLGRHQTTILMAREMCLLILARLHTSRIKDPVIQEAVIDFQRWVMRMFDMVNKGKFRPSRFLGPDDARAAYFALLSVPAGAQTSKAVSNLAAEEKKSRNTIYRRLQLIRGSNAIMTDGSPKRTRCDKGLKKHALDHDLVMAYLLDHVRARGTEIRAALGLKTSISRINAWIRSYWLNIQSLGK